MHAVKALLVFALACSVAFAAAEEPASQAEGAKVENKPATMPMKGSVRYNKVAEFQGGLITGSGLVNKLTSEGVAELNKVTAQSVKTNTLTAKRLSTSYIASEGGSIMVDSDMVISSDAQVDATAFLAENIVIGGVKQWKLVRHEDFEQGAEGWSLLETSSCSPKGDRFLGGHCNAAHATARKVFDKLPAHSHVRVKARYHFIDNWQGETAFLQLDGAYAWSDRAHAVAKGQGIQMCGSADHAETRMSAPIDVTLPHDASFLEVAFGSHGREGEDACQRSFGVDDVMVYVR